jgi:hypothetical protein
MRHWQHSIRAKIYDITPFFQVKETMYWLSLFGSSGGSVTEYAADMPVTHGGSKRVGLCETLINEVGGDEGDRTPDLGISKGFAKAWE